MPVACDDNDRVDLWTRLFATKAERYKKIKENDERQMDRYLHVQALKN